MNALLSCVLHLQYATEQYYNLKRMKLLRDSLAVKFYGFEKNSKQQQYSLNISISMPMCIDSYAR